MSKTLKIGWLFVVVLAFYAGPVAGRAATKTVAPDGPRPVGVRVMHLTIGGQTRPLLVWYPAADSARGRSAMVYNTGLQGDAVREAEPDRAAAPYPLIVFSHGMGGCAAQHVFINENLASFGFVVIAPDHQEAQMCHLEGKPEIGAGRLTWSVLRHHFDLSGVVFDLFGDMMKQRGYDFSYRPAEIKAVIDLALRENQDPPSFLRGLIAPDRIGMSGHSLGGYTTLMVGGLPFYCDPAPPADQCQLDDLALDRLPNPCCFDYVRTAGPFGFRDPRVKAILVMSPAVMFPDLPRAAAALQVPIMLINGDDQNFEVPWAPLQTIYDYAPAPKYLLRLQQTDHMTAADSTLTLSLARLVLPGFRSHFRDKAQAYKEYSVAFFNLYLKGQAPPTNLLDQPLNPFVEIWSKR